MKILLLLPLIFFTFSTFGQTPITPNQIIEKQIGLTETHLYSFSLEAGEFVRFEIQQKNVDPKLSISQTDNRVLHRLYFEKAVGKTAISFIAAEKNTFLLTLESSGSSKMAGNYRLQMTNPRASVSADQQRIEAEKTLTGNVFDLLKTKRETQKLNLEQRRQRVMALQGLLEIWQRLKDPLFEQETWHHIGLQADKLGDLELKQTAFEKVLSFARTNNDFLDEAWALYHLGNLLGKRGEIEKSQQYLVSALESAQKSGAKVVEAEMLNSLALFYKNRAQFEKGKEYLEKMLVIFRELKSEIDQAKAKVSLAMILDDIDPQFDSVSVFRESLKVFEKNEAFAEKANILRMLGADAADQGDFETAEKYLTESIALLEKYGEPKDEALSYLGLGLIKVLQSKFAEARQSFEKGLAKLPSGTEPITEIRLLVGLGRSDFTQGKLSEGLESLKKAAEIANRSQIIREQIEVNALLSTFYLAIGQNEQAFQAALTAKKISDASQIKSYRAIAANAVGRVYQLQGNYPQAITLFEETVKFAEESAQRRVVVLGYQTLGAVYYDLSDFARAEENTRKAIEILGKQASPLDKAYVNLLLAQIYLQQNNLSETKKALEEPLKFAQTTKNGSLEAQIQQILGRIAVKEEKFTEAEQKFTAALMLHSQNKNVVGISMALKGLGDSLLGMKKFDQAQLIYAQSLGVFRQIGSPTAEALVFENLMTLAKRKGQPRLAIFYGKQSIGLLQKVRGTIKPLEAEIRKSFIFSRESVYRNLAALLIDEGRVAEAHEVLVLLKEEEFYQFTRRSPDSVSNFSGKIDLTAEETKANQTYQELMNQITAVTTRVTQLEIKQRGQALTADDKAEMQKLQTALVALNTATMKYVGDLSVSFSQPASPAAELPNARTHDWQKKLAQFNSDTILLTTLVAENGYYVIITTPTARIARKVEIQSADLNGKIKKLQEVLKTPGSDFLPDAQKLYQILISPVDADLAQLKPKSLLWSLDGKLRYVPFAALHDGKNYLVERYTNAVVTLAQSPEAVKPAVLQWRALGAGVSDKIKGFDPLPQVLPELKKIVRDENSKETSLFVGRRLLNRDFTRQNLINALQQKFQLIHFATHFVFEPGSEIDSFLLLGDGGRLTLADFRNDQAFDLSGVDLLTFSACETGPAENDKSGAEIESLGVIAQKRGAKTVLATFWAITDNSTPQLMGEFYRIYKKGNVSKAEALRQAQIYLLKDKSNQSYRHPAYWASFIVLGEWR
jgi:CHAT domain-containing protein/uncharacterized protein HemY